MLPPPLQAFLLAVCASLCGSFPAPASLHLPPLLTDGAVLQRDEPIPIHGRAAPGETIAVTLGGQALDTVTNADGRWEVRFPPRPAGGPFRLQVESRSSTRTVEDILIGDVWVCSGQSNMVLPMARVARAFPAAIREARHPRIRAFTVPATYAFDGAREQLPGGSWTVATPASVGGFSALAFFFARSIEASRNVPVGVIISAVGGSPVEAWMSETALEAFPAHLASSEPFRDPAYIRGLKAAERSASEAWYAYRDRRDQGLHARPPFFDPRSDALAWNTLEVPGRWTDGGVPDIHGVVWFRRQFDLPARLAGKPATLSLGAIVDADTTYLNGVQVGATTYRYPPRHYRVPDGLLRAGTNTLVVRATSTAGPGEFVPGKEYQLEVDGTTIPLEGAWRYRIGMVAGPHPPQTFLEWQAGALYPAMIAPLHRQPVKGILWYQGESNTDRPEDYAALFRSLIRDWRERWRDPALPFLYVQLANYLPPSPTPMESGWAELREAQRQVLDVPHTAMVVAIDTGEWNDIHPLDKRTLGHRLALAARRLAYGEPALLASGPRLSGARVEGDQLLVSFSSVGEGLQTSDGKRPGHFAIAGRDGVYRWAEARLEGDVVVLSHPAVEHPSAVRYAWADNPKAANLVNSAGLPASPFAWTRADENEEPR